MSQVDATAPRLVTGPRRHGFARLHPLVRYAGRRLVLAAVTLLVATILIFAGTSVIPGSPASTALGREATPEAIAALNHQLGFDRPVTERYLSWLGDAVRGDLGVSALAVAQQDAETAVWSIIRGPLGNSLTLALITLALLIPLSLLLGVVAGLRAGRPADHLISTLTLTLMSLPEFVVGSLLIVIFSVLLGILPAVSLLEPGSSPLSDPRILVLPVLTLLCVNMASAVRMVRVGTIEVARSDYVRMARLHGLPERKVVRRYVLRNALAPSIQIFALALQYLLGGVIIVEAVFAYPGIGKQLVDAVIAHDNTTVQAIAMLLALVAILVNLVADLVLALLVPKLRTQP